MLLWSVFCRVHDKKSEISTFEMSVIWTDRRRVSNAQTSFRQQLTFPTSLLSASKHPSWMNPNNKTRFEALDASASHFSLSLHVAFIMRAREREKKSKSSREEEKKNRSLLLEGPKFQFAISVRLFSLFSDWWDPILEDWSCNSSMQNHLAQLRPSFSFCFFHFADYSVDIKGGRKTSCSTAAAAAAVMEWDST